MRSWINDKIQWLDDRSLGETEEEIAAKLAEYNQYKKEEKPEKAGEKSALEGLYNSIQVKLSSNNRPPFEADTYALIMTITKSYSSLFILLLFSVQLQWFVTA